MSIVNHCDICGKCALVVHFEDKNKEWIQMCYQCMSPIASEFIKINKNVTIKKIIRKYNKKGFNNGQVHLHL